MEKLFYYKFASSDDKFCINLKEKIFEICIQSGNQKINVSSDEFILISSEGGETGYEFHFKKELQNSELSVCVRGENTGEELKSSIQITHSGDDVVIHAVRYPYILREKVATFDHLLISSAWGDNLERPPKTISDAVKNPATGFGNEYNYVDGQELVYLYPSIMSMQYMVLYNQVSSFYLSTYSTTDDTMTFHVSAPTLFSVAMSVKHYPFLKNGTWTSPECSLSLLGGGWHESAKLYAKHMTSFFPAPDYPSWMREDYHGWAEIMMKREKSSPSFRFQDLPEIYSQLHKKTGIRHLFLAGWADDGHDTKFPRYIPCAQAGSPEDLRKGIEGIHQLGGICSLYTNARLIDTGAEFYHEGGKNAVCIDENGNEYLECYGTASIYAVACPGCDEYVNQMTRVAERIAGEYGADGMFVDQISCNASRFCYSEEHHHTRPGNNFLPGVERELSSLRKAHQKINPRFHTFSEGCHERFNRYYDVNQGHGEDYTWQISQSLPEQFLYTFPDRIVTGLCQDKHQMYHAMAQFKPLDIKDGCYQDETNSEPLHRYMHLREKNKKYFLQGRFIDDEGFTYTGDIRIFAVTSEDSTICMCIWKPGSVENTCNQASFKIPEGYGPGETFFDENAELVQDGDWYNIHWKGAICYLVLLRT